jgi:hypothetical protein
LGMINGGLGFRFSGPVGSDNVPKRGPIIYSLVAGLVGIFYTAFVISRTKKMGDKDPAGMKERYSYDSERPFNDPHDGFISGHFNNLREQRFTKWPHSQR